MKIKFIAVGKTDEPYLQEGITKYTERLMHYASFQMQIVSAKKQNSGLPTARQKIEEGKLILETVQANDYMVLLDEGGSEQTSVAFSIYLQKRMNVINTNFVFIAGGPFGFSDEVYERAQEKLSLSRMTFSHQMIRLLFVEQLYRAFTILKGEKYHHL